MIQINIYRCPFVSWSFFSHAHMQLNHEHCTNEWWWMRLFIQGYVLDERRPVRMFAVQPKMSWRTWEFMLLDIFTLEKTKTAILFLIIRNFDEDRIENLWCNSFELNDCVKRSLSIWVWNAKILQADKRLESFYVLRSHRRYL